MDRVREAPDPGTPIEGVYGLRFKLKPAGGWLNRLATQIDGRISIGFRAGQFRDEHPLAWEAKTKGVRLV